MISVAVLGLFTSGLMYWISMRLMREIPASAATSAAFMIPLFGVAWGGMFLGEPVTWGMAPGCVLVLTATALITGFNPFSAARQALSLLSLRACPQSMPHGMRSMRHGSRIESGMTVFAINLIAAHACPTGAGGRKGL